MKTRVLFLIFCAIVLSLNASAFEDKSWSPDFSQRIVIEKGTKHVNGGYRFKTDNGRSYKVLNSTGESESHSGSGSMGGGLSMPSYRGAGDVSGASFGASAPIYSGAIGGRQRVSNKGNIWEYGVEAFNSHGEEDWEYRGLSTPNFTSNSDDEEPAPVGDAMVPMMLMLMAFAAFKFIKK